MIAEVCVNWLPVICMPSPESPAKRITTSSCCCSGSSEPGFFMRVDLFCEDQPCIPSRSRGVSVRGTAGRTVIVPCAEHARTSSKGSSARRVFGRAAHPCAERLPPRRMEAVTRTCRPRFAGALSTECDSARALGDALAELEAGLAGTTPDLVLAFATHHHGPALEE